MSKENVRACLARGLVDQLLLNTQGRGGGGWLANRGLV
jgi:hypothetical protein